MNITTNNLLSNSNTYLYKVFTVFSLLIAAAAWWNYSIDPYGMWQIKPEKQLDLFWHTRLHKPYRINKLEPSRLILGSSRSGRIPPTTPPGKQTYNASHPGATLYELFRQLEHGQNAHPLKSIIVGLDYYMFREGSQKMLLDDFEDRLLRINPNLQDKARHNKQVLLDYWRVLFSRSALLSSINANNDQQGSNRRFYPMGDWEAVTQRTSTELFDIMAKKKIKEFTKLSSELDPYYLESLLGLSLTSNITVDILISPIHAHQMAVIEEAGQWKTYLKYYKTVVAVADKFRAQGLNIRVLGLEHQKALVHEPIADAYWYQDGIHYSRATGKEIIRCIWGGALSQCDSVLKPKALTAANLNDYLTVVSGNLNQYTDNAANDS